MEKIALKNLSSVGQNNYIISPDLPTIFYGANQRPFRLDGGAILQACLLGQFDTHIGINLGNTLPFSVRFFDNESIFVSTSFVTNGSNPECPMKIKIIGEISGNIAEDTKLVYDNSTQSFNFEGITIPRGEKIFLSFENLGGVTSKIDVENWCLSARPN